MATIRKQSFSGKQHGRGNSATFVAEGWFGSGRLKLLPYRGHKAALKLQPTSRRTPGRCLVFENNLSCSLFVVMKTRTRFRVSSQLPGIHRFSGTRCRASGVRIFSFSWSRERRIVSIFNGKSQQCFIFLFGIVVGSK
jgi:hypothetical protein